MTHRRRLFGIVSAIAILSAAGCAARGVGNVKALPDDTRLLVVSALGDTFHYKYIGVTVFTNAEKDIAVDWDIDGSLTERLMDARSRFRFVKLPKSEESIRTGLHNLEDEIAGSEAGQRLVGVADKLYVDGIILIDTYEHTDQIFFTNQRYGGIGLARHASDARLYVRLSISLLDPNSLETIASIQETRSMNNRPIEFEDISDVSAADIEHLESKLEGLGRRTLLTATSKLTLQ